MFDKILIANRGEIALRIARTCRELGVATVAVYSDADSRSLHVAGADEAVALPGTSPADTYLKMDAIIDAALASGADAIHPGYGFLSENAEFARAVADAGLVWVGPPAEAIDLLGDKITARRIAVDAGVPVVPGLTEPVDDAERVREFAERMGYPIAIKASGGGGGRGLKIALHEDDLEDALDSARREALAYFGSSDVFAERYLEAPKHLEVQILGLVGGDAVWLGVRDCSLQRRHQKLVEETPPPRPAPVEEMGAAAVALAKATGYVNAGTVEMLLEEGEFYFLEVNARLQVEHTVTEEVFGIDLVECQLKIASGEELGFAQDDLRPRGHAIECRINAEDPARGFAPAPGRVTRYVEPRGIGVRVDSGYGEGSEIPSAYDSLVAKLVVSGSTRDQARRRALRALSEFVIEGVPTTIAAHLLLLESQVFAEGNHTTRTLEEGGLLASLGTAPGESQQDVLMVGTRAVSLWHPAMAASAAGAVHATVSGGEVVAPMQGTVLKVLVREGEVVEPGASLIVVEAMKMETSLAAPMGGRVSQVPVAPGDSVTAGQVVAVVTKPE